MELSKAGWRVDVTMTKCKLYLIRKKILIGTEVYATKIMDLAVISNNVVHKKVDHIKTVSIWLEILWLILCSATLRFSIHPISTPGNKLYFLLAIF